MSNTVLGKSKGQLQIAPEKNEVVWTKQKWRSAVDVVKVSLIKTDAEAPVLWPPDAKNQLIGKDPDAGKDWRQEKGMTEDKMVR